MSDTLPTLPPSALDERQLAFGHLLDRARAGDTAAAQELYSRYSQTIQKVVRRTLHRKLRRRFDSMDFVQSAWARFLELSPDDYRFDSPQEFVAFLARLAYNKVVDTTRRRLGTQKDNLANEVPFEGVYPGERNPDRVLAGPTPTPSQFAMADERWQQLTGGLPEGHRRILELLRAGHSHQEIVNGLGIHQKIVQRLVARLRRCLEEE